MTVLDYPKVIRNLILTRQEEQTGRRDLTVFVHSPSASSVRGGIDWASTPENAKQKNFWSDVLGNQKLEAFYDLYKFKKSVRIGLDIDGVLADFERHFLDWLGLPGYPAEAWDDRRFRDNFYKIESDSNFWMTLPAIIYGSDLLFNPEIFVTARPMEQTSITESWLYGKNLFAKQNLINVGQGNSKVEALKGKVDIFLDDAIHNFEELNDNGINCYLITRNHNKDYHTSKRFDSLYDFQRKCFHKNEIEDSWRQTFLQETFEKN